MSPPADVVRAQLTRILGSEIFSRSDRLTAFLTFIVEQSLDGRGVELKEHVLAMEVYGKTADFDTALDPIVRVDARRLRDKLREYYASSPHDPIIIAVPKGSYAPTFETNRHAAATNIEAIGPAAASRSRVWSVGAAMVVLGVAALLGIAFARGLRSASAAPSILTVTSFPGAEEVPSLSPDGNFVAFLWSGPVSPGSSDLWVKAVDGEDVRQLTNTPQANETWAAWSPDGKQIAFSRREGPVGVGIFVISPLGGRERKVSDAIGTAPAWFPDSQSLAVGIRTSNTTAIFRENLQTGTRRQLTWPPLGQEDRFAAVSPDSKTLAFARIGANQWALFVAPLTGGEPTRRTNWSAGIRSVAWTPDGRDVLFSQMDTSGARIFRVAAFGNEEPEAVPGLPIDAQSVSVSHLRSGREFRVAFDYGHPDVGLRLVDLRSASTTGMAAKDVPFSDSTRTDAPGRFSRDGVRVAFTSNRNGHQQVWVADRDGLAPRSVTALDGAAVKVGSWSPDGRSIAFDMVVAGNPDIYVVGADGGPLRRLTDRPARDSDPEWSRDGRWIYFSSNATGTSEIWKIPATGGSLVQLTTHGGGYEPREASDGQTIYYVDKPARNGLDTLATLKQVPAGGGSEDVVLSPVTPGAWDITDAGIVFLTGDPGARPQRGVADALKLYTFADRQIRRLTDLSFLVSRPAVTPRLLTVSRDGRWALLSHIDGWERDILVADHFR